MPRRFPNLAGLGDRGGLRVGARDRRRLLRHRSGSATSPAGSAFVVADVTGKGIPAAILMADARGLIHAAADHSSDPADIPDAGQPDPRPASGQTSLFVTVAHGVLDARDGRLRLASAGHDPVHVLRADGSLEVARADGPADRDGRRASRSEPIERTILSPGDAIVAHTDGVTEARSPDGAFYGEERFTALLRSLAGRSASEIVGRRRSPTSTGVPGRRRGVRRPDAASSIRRAPRASVASDAPADRRSRLDSTRPPIADREVACPRISSCPRSSSCSSRTRS